jgi:twitching motility two-component system response regulator PilH
MERKKILVIEDQEDTLAYLTVLLEDNGYLAVGARDGAEGLEKAREEVPDAITLDVSMPEKSGIKTLQELQKDPVTKGIPVVIVTGLSDDFRHYIHHRRQIAPPAGYISKPIDKKELLDTLRKILS